MLLGLQFDGVHSEFDRLPQMTNSRKAKPVRATIRDFRPTHRILSISSNFPVQYLAKIVELTKSKAFLSLRFR